MGVFIIIMSVHGHLRLLRVRIEKGEILIGSTGRNNVYIRKIAAFCYFCAQ